MGHLAVLGERFEPKSPTVQTPAAQQSGELYNPSKWYYDSQTGTVYNPNTGEAFNPLTGEAVPMPEGAMPDFFIDF